MVRDLEYPCQVEELGGYLELSSMSMPTLNGPEGADVWWSTALDQNR